MPEQTLWAGTSSQWKNFGAFLLCVLVIPIPWAIYRWLVVKTTKFELTTERLVTRRGIFSVETDTLELYRVHDMAVTESFLQRLVGLKTVQLVTGDTTSPRVLIDHIPASLKLQDTIRKQVEECRMRKRVRTVDVEDSDQIHPGDADALG